MFSYLPRRDDVASFAPPRVDDEIKNAAGLSERLNPLLAVVLATVDRFDDLWIIENADCLRKIDLAGLPVFSALLLIPAKHHDTIRCLFCVHNLLTKIQRLAPLERAPLCGRKGDGQVCPL